MPDAAAQYRKGRRAVGGAQITEFAGDHVLVAMARQFLVAARP